MDQTNQVPTFIVIPRWVKRVFDKHALPYTKLTCRQTLGQHLNDKDLIEYALAGQHLQTYLNNRFGIDARFIVDDDDYEHMVCSGSMVLRAPFNLDNMMDLFNTESKSRMQQVIDDIRISAEVDDVENDPSAIQELVGIGVPLSQIDWNFEYLPLSEKPVYDNNNTIGLFVDKAPVDRDQSESEYLFYYRLIRTLLNFDIPIERIAQRVPLERYVNSIQALG